MHNKWKIMLFGLWFLSIVSLSNSVVLQTANMKYIITITFNYAACSNGLLTTTENVTLDIKVTDIKKAPTKNTHFVLELLDPVNSVAFTMCKLPFKPSCTLHIVQGCYCVPAPAKEYHFQYRSLTNNAFSNGQLMVNGEMVPGLVYPTSLLVNPPPVQLSINGGDSVPMYENCTTKAPANKNASFTFCVSGLFSPQIFTIFGSQRLNGLLRENTTRDCFTGKYKVWNKAENVTFKYFNCSDLLEFRCTVQGVKEKTAPGHDEGNDSDLIMKSLLISIAAVTLLSIVAILCKLKKKKRNISHDLISEPGFPSITNMISSPVDPEPAKSRSSSARLTLKSMSPSVIGRRTTVKMSRHRSSTEV